MKLIDSRMMRSLDSKAIRGYGVRGVQLMENAGRGVAEVVVRELERKAALGKRGTGRVTVIAGKGNNGGDGFVAARHLKNSGIEVEVVSLAARADIKGDAVVNMNIWERMGGRTHRVRTLGDIKKRSSALVHSTIIVDAIFGTGLNSQVRGVHGEMIGFINGLDRTVVSIDVPSGIDASTGAILGAAVEADVTVTLAIPKAGLYLYPARRCAGRVEVADIGMPADLVAKIETGYELADDAFARENLRAREPDSHKAANGHVVVFGGSPGKSGAVYMAAMGAMRAGCGLCTIGVPEALNPVMEIKTTEAMTCALSESAEGTLGPGSIEQALSLIKGKDAVVLGPGLGSSADTARFVSGLIGKVRGKLPLIIDADALNVLAGNLSTLKRARFPIVLTPHPGEAARLLDLGADDIQADRIKAARALVKKTGAVVVLKGAASVVGLPDGTISINPTGNAGLATAGTGDVLAGMIGAFAAQGYGAARAAILGVFLHGAAAERVAEEKGVIGMIATDLLGALPRVIDSFISPPNGAPV